MKKKCAFCSAIYAEEEFFCPECAGLVYDLIDDAQAAQSAPARAPQKPVEPVKKPDEPVKARVVSAPSKPAPVQEAFRVERVVTQPERKSEPKAEKGSTPVRPAPVQEAFRVERPWAQPEKKVEVKTEPKTEVKPEPKPAPKAEVKSESKAEVKPAPKAEVKPAPQAEAAPAQKLTRAELDARRAALKPMKLMNWYTSESPMLGGTNKATGELRVESDGLVLHKKMGNGMGAAFGVVGMVMAKKKAEKESKEVSFPYAEIRESVVGKVTGLTPAIVLRMKNGMAHTFCNYTQIASTATVQSVVDVINGYIALSDQK